MHNIKKCKRVVNITFNLFVLGFNLALYCSQQSPFTEEYVFHFKTSCSNLHFDRYLGWNGTAWTGTSKNWFSERIYEIMIKTSIGPWAMSNLKSTCIWLCIIGLITVTGLDPILGLCKCHCFGCPSLVDLWREMVIHLRTTVNTVKTPTMKEGRCKYHRCFIFQLLKEYYMQLVYYSF